MYLHVLFVVLSAYVSISECTCRTGFEAIGEVIYAAEKQLDNVFNFANMVCPPCVNDTEFGCFINLLNHFKMDLEDLRTFEYTVIDSFLNSSCSFEGNTLFVGGDNDVATQKVANSTSTDLPIINNFGIDCDLRNNLLVYARVDTFEIIKTDGNGMNPMPVTNGSMGNFLQRPRILDSNTFYYLGSGGGIFRVTNGVSEEILSADVTGVIWDLELDPLEGLMYWTTSNVSETSVFRATLDGQDVNTLFTDTNNPISLSLESFTRRLYFTSGIDLKYFDLRSGTIGDVSSLTGSTSEISVCTNTIYASYIGAPGTWEVRDLNGTVTGPVMAPDTGTSNIVALATCNLIP